MANASEQTVGEIVDASPAKRPRAQDAPAGRSRSFRSTPTPMPTLCSRAPTAATRIASGPICSTAPTRTAPLSAPISRPRRKSEDPLFFAIIDKASGKAVGYQTFLRIEPQHRVIEVGNILYTPAMQRTIGATEAQYLFARLRLRRTRLSPLRMEMQRSQRAFEARGRAFRLHLRRRVSPAYDRQGPQSRHRLVFDARQRMAGAPRRFRAMAGAR